MFDFLLSHWDVIAAFFSGGFIVPKAVKMAKSAWTAVRAAK
jgi:hypothetical protein